jgi:hypothetical protein
MDVFEFRGQLVNDYRVFTRSFIQPKVEDINTFLDSEYDSSRYWPSPLIQINPPTLPRAPQSPWPTSLRTKRKPKHEPL